jgi:drug/metabolite transporter (DMT)-like permease
MPVHLLIPVACAVLYVLGALTVKRAAVFGPGVWRTSFVANWLMFAVFVPWWFWRGGTLHPVSQYWQPAITALCFLGGQVFVFLALNRGDVSVTTPVMGTKVILVALFSSLLHVGVVPLKWWIGAALSAGAVALLHLGERQGRGRNVAATVLLASLSAGSYGLGDVLMQKWVPAWGTGSYFPPMFLLVGLYSFAFVPLFDGPLSQLSRPAVQWLALGGLLMALNNAGIVLALGIWGGATAVNIVYSVRGLLSVVMVWAVGHWFSSDEKQLAPAVLRSRLMGAALMVGAIVAVLV